MKGVFSLKRVETEEKCVGDKDKILIVDDDILNLKLLAASLSAGSYECVTAQDGYRALESIEKEHPDLILLDIMMPGLDGFEIAAKVKENPTTRNIPIILITALDGSDNKVRGLEAGADEFLNKPIHAAELQARVNSLLRLKHYQEQLASRSQSEYRFLGPMDRQECSRGRIKLPNILVVDDDEKDARLIQMHLHGQPYEVKTVTSGEAALTCAAQERVDLILLDILLPGIDGFEVARSLKGADATRNIQIVALTSLQDLESKIKGIELGVDDYLMKPVNSHELRARISALVKKKAYLDDLQSDYQSAVRAAITDRLTGLYNHAYFYHVLENELKRARRHGRSVALLMMDIDDFKMINDTMGHLAGDEILKSLGNLITVNAREIDVPFRYGGEEFALILPYTDSRSAFSAAERLRKIISDCSFTSASAKEFKNLTVSIGISNFPGDAITLEELVKKADAALYRAKSEGKNRICVHR